MTESIKNISEKILNGEIEKLKIEFRSQRNSRHLRDEI